MALPYENASSGKQATNDIQKIDEWQPIETAPRDGTWVILEGEFDGGDTSSNRVGRWAPVWSDATRCPYEWQVISCVHLGVCAAAPAVSECVNWYSDGRVHGWAPLPK